MHEFLTTTATINDDGEKDGHVEDVREVDVRRVSLGDRCFVDDDARRVVRSVLILGRHESCNAFVLGVTPPTESLPTDATAGCEERGERLG
jgi:hypothetical protein